MKRNKDMEIQTASGKLEQPLQGNVDLFVKDAGIGLALDNVLQHPGLQLNLLSVAQLCNKETGIARNVNFDGERGTIYAKDGSILAVATLQSNGLHALEFSSVVPTLKQLSVDSSAVSLPGVGTSGKVFIETVNAGELFHKRIGHLGAHKTSQLTQASIDTGINVFKDKPSETVPMVVRATIKCAPCLQSKSIHHAHMRATSLVYRAQRPLQVLHADLIGPIQPTQVSVRRNMY